MAKKAKATLHRIPVSGINFEQVLPHAVPPVPEEIGTPSLSGGAWPFECLICKRTFSYDKVISFTRSIYEWSILGSGRVTICLECAKFDPVNHRFATKEDHVREYIREEFPQFSGSDGILSDFLIDRGRYRDAALFKNLPPAGPTSE